MTTCCGARVSAALPRQSVPHASAAAALSSCSHYTSQLTPHTAAPLLPQRHQLRHAAAAALAPHLAGRDLAGACCGQRAGQHAARKG